MISTQLKLPLDGIFFFSGLLTIRKGEISRFAEERIHIARIRLKGYPKKQKKRRKKQKTFSIDERSASAERKSVANSDIKTCRKISLTFKNVSCEILSRHLMLLKRGLPVLQDISNKMSQRSTERIR